MLSSHPSIMNNDWSLNEYLIDCSFAGEISVEYDKLSVLQSLLGRLQTLLKKKFM